MSWALVNADPDDPHHGAYLAAYDPDWTPDGQPGYPSGIVDWTTDPAKAMRFQSPSAAYTTWTTPCVHTPTRPDGEPNRPLMAYTIEVRRVP